MVKVSRNNPCPCGSGKRYKHCCQTKGIDFDKLTHNEWMRCMPVRGKNIEFVNRIGEALQLDTIERCMALWSAENDTILTPFMGIGSEIYVAVKNKRKGIGIELKTSYYRQAVKNISCIVKKRENLL